MGFFSLWTNRFWGLFLILGVVGTGLFFGLGSWELAHIYSFQTDTTKPYILWLSYLGQSYVEVFIFLSTISNKFYNLWFVIAGWYRLWIIAAIVGAVVGLIRGAKIKELRILPSGEIAPSPVRGQGAGIKLILPFPKKVSLRVLFSPQLRILYRHNAINVSNLMLLSIIIAIVRRTNIDNWWLLSALEDNQELSQRLSPLRVATSRRLSQPFKATIAMFAQIFYSLKYSGAPTQATLAVLEALCVSANDYSNYQLAELETAIKLDLEHPLNWSGNVESFFAALAIGPDSETKIATKTATMLIDIEEQLVNRLCDQLIVGPEETKNELFFYKGCLFVPLRKLTTLVNTLLGPELITATLELSKQLQSEVGSVPYFTKTISQNQIFQHLLELDFSTESQAKLSRSLKIPFKNIPDVQLAISLLKALGWFRTGEQLFSAGNIYLVERIDENSRELRRACIVLNCGLLIKRWGSAWKESVRTFDNLRLNSVDIQAEQHSQVLAVGGVV